jgi:Zn finger protein HypA/HybF involved in hydrogenase expression
VKSFISEKTFSDNGIYVSPDIDTITFIFTIAECARCGHEWRIRSIPFCCPKCHTRHLELKGYEIVDIEV